MVMESVLAVADGNLGVNGFGLLAPLAEVLTVCIIDSGNANPVADGAAPVVEPEGVPKFDVPDGKVDMPVVGASVGNVYPVDGVAPPTSTPGAGYDDGIVYRLPEDVVAVEVLVPNLYPVGTAGIVELFPVGAAIPLPGLA